MITCGCGQTPTLETSSKRKQNRFYQTKQKQLPLSQNLIVTIIFEKITDKTEYLQSIPINTKQWFSVLSS